LSIHQQASAPELIHSEFYHTQRGRRFMTQLQYDSAIESFLQAVSLGAAGAADSSSPSSSSSPPFSASNDFALIGWLGEAYAAVGEIEKAEQAFLFAISLNR
jgi:tetratricopeptide (TPR) repeat protein